jgi:hypothetical protein
MAQSKLEDTIRRGIQVQSKIVGKLCTSANPDCIRSEKDELRALLKDYTLWKLNQSGGNIDELLADFRKIDDAFLYQEKIWEEPTVWSGGPPFVFRQEVAGTELIIAVNYFASGALAFPSGVVIIQGFRNQGGQYIFGGEEGQAMCGVLDLRNTQILRSPRPLEVWLLVFGQVGGGFMGDLDRARIYSFDGYRFKEVWAPEDRQNMMITVSGDTIHNTFLGRKQPRFGGDLQEGMEERLQLTAAGVIRTSLVNHGENWEPPAKK